MSVNPSPIGGYAAQFFDNNGVILSGGKIYTYAAGTTTPQATYTSASGVTPHSNPIVLDSAGRVPGGEIWLTDGLVYKFVIETSNGILIGSYDNITGVNSNFVNYTVQEEVITATAGQTVFNLSTINYAPGTNSLSVYIDGVNQYVGTSYLETDSTTVTFTSGVHVGAEVKFTTAVQSTTGAVNADIVTYDPPFTGGVATNVQDKLAQYISVKDFGAVCDGVTDDAAALALANSAANSESVALLIPGVMYIGAATNITAPIVDTSNQIFTLTSDVTIDNGLPVRPDWWGSSAGTLVKAVDALPATGGEIALLARDYNIVGSYGWIPFTGPYVGIEKPNVVLRGSGMPLTASDGSRFESGTGTVIQGTLVNYADGFEAYDLGVDVGPYVTATYNFGSYVPEGFVPGAHRFQGTPSDLTSYIQNVAFGNIRVLADSSTFAHAILAEFINGLSHGYCEAEGGYHGYVCKSVNVVGGNVWAYGQVGDGYIIKSDQYTLAQNIAINSITVGKRGYATRTAQGFLQSTTGGYITSRVSIASLNGWNCKELLTRVGDPEPITDIMVGQIMGDDIDGNGFSILGDMRRIQIGNHVISNATSNGVYVDSTSGASIDIGSGAVTNCDSNGYYFVGPNHSHGDINAINNGGYGINRNGDARLDWNRVTGSGNSLGIINSLLEILTAADLQNSWANSVGAWPFQVVQVGNTLNFRGTVKNGTTNVIATLPVGYRPALTLSFITVAVTAGGTRAFAHVDVQPSGEIQVANFSGGAPGLGGTGSVVALNFTYIL